MMTSRRWMECIAWGVVLLVVFGETGLVAALEIRVRSSAEDGKPVVGAVASSWSIKENGTYTRLGRAVTDEKGIARLPVPGGGLQRLVVWADDYVRQDVDLPASLPDAFEIRLDRGLSKVLRVRDAAGLPVNRFRLTVVPEERLSFKDLWAISMRNVGGPAADVATAVNEGRRNYDLEGYRPRTMVSSEGEVVLRGLSRGNHRVLLSAPGFGVVDRRVSMDKKGAVTLVLDDRDCREIQVVDARSGQGIEGAFSAPAAAFVEGPYATIWPAWQTRPDGMLPLGCPEKVLGLPAGRIIAAKEHAPLVVVAGERGARIVLGPGAQVRGSALTAEDVPLAGARVIASVSGFRRTGEVDANGGYLLTGVPAGTVHLRLVEGESGAWIAGRTLVAGDGETYEVNFTPGRESRLFLQRNGEPWPEVTVVVVADAEGETSILALGRADEEGRVRLPCLEGSSGELGIMVFDGSEFVSVPVPKKGVFSRLKELVTGSDDADVITVNIEGRFIDGRVVDAATGEGLELHSVDAQGTGHCRGIIVDPSSPLYLGSLGGMVSVCVSTGAKTGTDERGRFRLFAPRGAKRLLASGYSLTAGDDQYESASRDIRSIPPGKRVTIPLQKAGSVRVEISDSAGNVPPGCSVEWRRAVWGPDDNGSTTSCGDEGVSFLSPPSETPVFIVARADGLAPALEGPLVLPRGGADSLRLVLRAGGSLRILVDEAPQFNGRAYVPEGTLRDGAGRDWTMVEYPRISPGFKEIAFSLLPPGKWTVDLGGKRRTVHVEAGKEAVADLRD